ncbi:c-type cytochrome [Luteimonas kalidii]|uniref:C-type cytochrome n=1 Tax=Luteimonas kalidii TaxID=3042025 RepID=A0ABT6JSH1_9GAMM|nr:c-type cytochrome [Luteimonas kalidii]MDH5833647.1 c-type cytochrome [Luteimonas kalidii]
MTRPLTIAAGFAVALLALASLPSTATAQEAPAPASEDAAPAANASAAPAAPAPVPAPAAAAPAGNADTGRLLTYTCQGCHGIVGYKNVYPTYHVPRIGGQSAVYLTNALNEYRKGTRQHPTMQAQAQSFSDQDIADIAAFLSELTR